MIYSQDEVRQPYWYFNCSEGVELIYWHVSPCVHIFIYKAEMEISFYSYETFKSPTTRLFVQHVIRATKKVNAKATHYWSLWGKTTWSVVSCPKRLVLWHSIFISRRHRLWKANSFNYTHLILIRVFLQCPRRGIVLTWFQGLSDRRCR